ncbi:MAG TPA: hypothetical protein VGP89_17975 [Candidatus Angelobacter sp.]|jgi:hypothetical protein|nr:hypothetical protein [Candidatus Angelobacter sp.]
MNPPSPQTFFTEHIKPHAPTYITSVATSLLFLSTMIFNYSGQSQHAKDVQISQGTAIEQNREQIKSLQDQLNKEGSVVAVIGQFKEDTTKRLDRIESLILRDIHLNQQPAH